MLLLNSVEPEKWYSVRDTAKILGWSEDWVYRKIRKGILHAQIDESGSDRRHRTYTSFRVQGCEIIRYAKEHMTTLKPEKIRFRAA
jgi:hypothetical protein